MYPEKNLISFSDNFIGVLPFYIPLRLVAGASDHAFQLWFILMCALNYTSCYFLLLYLFRNNYASALGAMIFAFSIALHSQVAHAQTFPRFVIPLAFLMVLRFFKDFHPKYFLFLMLLFSYQVYCGIYMGLLLLFPLGVFFTLMATLSYRQLKPKFRDKRWRWKIVGAGAAGVLVLLPLLVPYLKRASYTGFHHYQDIIMSVPSPISRFYCHPGSLFWTFLSKINEKHPTFWDDQIFPGGIALLCFFILTGYVLVKLFRRATHQIPTSLLIITATAWVTILFFTRFGKFSFYNIVYNVIPGYPSMRVLERIINVELIFYAVAVAFVFTLIQNKKHLRLLLFVLVAAVIVADNYVRPQNTDRFLLSESRKRISYITERFNKESKSTILSFEPDTIAVMPQFYHLDAMLASQQLHVRTLNGYSATSPADYTPYWMKPSSETRKQWITGRNISADSVQVIR